MNSTFLVKEVVMSEGPSGDSEEWTHEPRDVPCRHLHVYQRVTLPKAVTEGIITHVDYQAGTVTVALESVTVPCSDLVK